MRMRTEPVTIMNFVLGTALIWTVLGGEEKASSFILHAEIYNDDNLEAEIHSDGIAADRPKREIPSAGETFQSQRSSFDAVLISGDNRDINKQGEQQSVGEPAASIKDSNWKSDRQGRGQPLQLGKPENVVGVNGMKDIYQYLPQALPV